MSPKMSARSGLAGKKYFPALFWGRFKQVSTWTETNPKFAKTKKTPTHIAFQV